MVNVTAAVPTNSQTLNKMAKTTVQLAHSLGFGQEQSVSEPITIILPSSKADSVPVLQCGNHTCWK